MRIGAHYLGNGECEFTVWAPIPDTVAVQILSPQAQTISMKPLEDGYWQAIAQDVYQQLAAAMPTHVSRRGMLKHPGVQHSCVRDLKMFQAYLWLCVMEQDMAAIETELVRLCLMVFPSIGVKWELIHRSIDLLVSELNDRVTPNELNLIQPYTTGMQKAFANLYYPEAKS